MAKTHTTPASRTSPTTSIGARPRSSSPLPTTLMAAALACASVASAAVAPVSSAAAASARTFVPPASVTPAGTACKERADGTWDVTVQFKVTGGRYNNLGHPAGASAIVNDAAYGDGRYDNVRKGGTRYIESSIHFLYDPGMDEYGQPSPQTATFRYQHAVAPITKQHTYVSAREIRILKQNIDVTFTCP